MKSKDIKQWVVSKKKSLTDIFAGRAPDEGSGEGMDIDKLMNDDAPRPPSKATFLAKGNPFRIDDRYSYVKTLGLGAYGVVCAVRDSQQDRKMAVKKVAGVFNDLTDAKRIIREIRLLCSMNHENILSIIDIDEPENYDTFNDVYIITELMDTDLNKLLRSSHPLVDSQRKFFTYQLLRSLKYIHSANILHRDLKPANILVSETCDVKLCDFGLARYVDPIEAQGQNMTEYVVTRWYRAPELLLASEEYTAAIDMWSVGCLIAELYSRSPIFPGRDVKNQIEIICSKVGKPSADEIKTIPNHRARAFISRLTDSDRMDFRSLLPGACPAAIDLVDRLLQFDPAKRLSAAEALCHPYVYEYRDAESETSASFIDFTTLEPPSELKLGKEGVRRLMWNEILRFHPEARERETDAAREAEIRVNEFQKK